MDDVLASIRRIVRAEKDPEAAGDISETSAGGYSGADAGADEDMPLELTPDMRTDAEAAAESAASDPAPAAPASAPADAPEMAASAAAALDPDAVKAMVRDAVIEQLSGDQGAELVRNILRDELMSGEIGNNMSQNVMRLIQAEVSKAIGS